MRISVVIPAYNAARWLADAIRSVQSQTLAPAEILVVRGHHEFVAAAPRLDDSTHDPAI